MAPSLRDLLFLTYTICVTASFSCTTAAEDGGDAVSYTRACDLCGKEITSASDCKTASAAMGLTWEQEEYDKDWPSGCHEARFEHGFSTGVFYNRHPSGNELGVDAWSICIYEEYEEDESTPLEMANEEEESTPLEMATSVAVLLCCCGGCGAWIWWRCCRRDQRPLAEVMQGVLVGAKAVPVVAQAVPVAVPVVAQILACGSCSKQFQSPPDGGLCACPHCGIQMQLPEAATAVGSSKQYDGAENSQV